MRQGLRDDRGRGRFQAREAFSSLWEAKWEMAMPVVVMVGIFGGFATMVEAAALTVLYALVVETAVYRDLNLGRDLGKILVECSMLIGGFLIILGCALGPGGLPADPD